MNFNRLWQNYTGLNTAFLVLNRLYLVYLGGQYPNYE